MKEQLLLKLFDHISQNEIRVEQQRQKLNRIILQTKADIKIIFDNYISPDPATQEDKFVNASDILAFMKQFLISDDLIQVEKIQIMDLLALFENFDFN